jgi:hypothetical protein
LNIKIAPIATTRTPAAIPTPIHIFWFLLSSSSELLAGSFLGGGEEDGLEDVVLLLGGVLFDDVVVMTTVDWEVDVTVIGSVVVILELDDVIILVEAVLVTITEDWGSVSPWALTAIRAKKTKNA